MKQFLWMMSILFLLLLFHDATITGTENGLLLWYQTLIPSLLPFILVTNALSETNAYQAVAVRFQKMSSNIIYEIIAILLGNLCGYPIGGKIINDFVKNQYLSKKQADHILPLASQASPMFLIGYVYTHIIHSQIPLYIFMGSIYIPVMTYYIILSIHTTKTVHITNCVLTHRLCIKDSFLHAVETMVMIGIYVIIFSILLTILLPYCQHDVLKVLLSFLEITTGLKLLNTLDITTALHISIICCLSAFGGLCSVFQIKGVLDYSTPNIKKYLLDKCILSTGTFCIIYLYFSLS